MFNSFGILGPIIITAKILLQILWQDRLAWNDEVSNHICQKLIKFCDSLHLLNTSSFGVILKYFCGGLIVIVRVNRRHLLPIEILLLNHCRHDDDQWFHVRSGESPADCLLQGVPTAQLIASNLCWKGPSWLKGDSLPLDSAFSDILPDQKDFE